jgi:hypothetical protein
MEQSSSGNSPNFIRQITRLGAIVGAIIINIISNIFPLNGLNIGIINTYLNNVVIILLTKYLLYGDLFT